MTRLRPGKNPSDQMSPDCRSNDRTSCPVAASHTDKVLSQACTNKWRPSDENLPPEDSRNVLMSWPVDVSQSISIMSPLPGVWLLDNTRSPPGANSTSSIAAVCPSNVRMSCPDAASHSLTVLSLLPESTSAPSGENATAFTASVCPSYVRIGRPVAAS